MAIKALREVLPAQGLKRVRPELWLQLLAALLCAALVLVPMAMMVYGSFRTARPGEPGILTLANYQRLAQPRFALSLLLTCLVALAVALGATVIGFLLAWVVTRTDTPFRGTIEILAVVPFFITPFLGALAWIILAAPERGLLNHYLMRVLGIDRIPFNIYSYGGIIWVLTLFLIPVPFLLAAGTLRNMDPSLEESSRVLGVGSLQTLRRVTVPLMLPSILSGFLLAFILAAENFGVPILLGPPAQIYLLTTRIYELVAVWPADYNMGAALSMVLLAVVMFSVLAQRWMLGSRQFTTVTGKGFRPSLIELGRWRYFTLGCCLLYLLIAVGLPYCALAVLSLSRTWTGVIDPAYLTLRQYRWILFEYPEGMRAIKNTFIVATVGATVALSLAVLIAYIVQRSELRLRKVVEYLAMAPLGIPGLVIGVGLLWTYVYLPMAIYGTLLVLILAYTTRYLPYGVRSISSALLQIGRELEEASRATGASWLYTLWKVTVPLLRPAIVVGWITLVVIFFREISASILLFSPGNQVVSVALFTMWNEGLFVEAAALGLIQATIVLGLIYGFQLLTRTRISVV